MHSCLRALLTVAIRPPALHPLAPSRSQEGFRPAKYFSVDRVFRNEAIDRTHLAEFHQIEGARAPGLASFVVVCRVLLL